MKIIKKIVALICCIALVATFSACGKSQNDANTLYVVSINKGYGTEWLKSVAKAYEAKNSDISIDIKPVYDDGIIKNNLESGAQFCNYDLMFTGNFQFSTPQYLADLSDLYSSVPEGKDKTVEELLDKTVRSAFKMKNDSGEDKYYYMPWTNGVEGLLVNYDAAKTVLGSDWESKYKMRTTDELLEFAYAIKNAGKDVYAFGHCADTHYYHFLYETWWAQCEGTESIKNYYNGRYYDEISSTMEIGPEICKQEGRLQSLKVMESIFAGKGLSDKDNNGRQFDTIQTLFMKGKFVLFSNGDWNNLEMSKSYPNVDVRFVRCPIISKLGEKLGITEEKLRAIIDYVDGETSQKPEVADSVIEKIREARCLTHSQIDAQTMAIPAYSTKINIAKDFVKFLISQEGQNIFVEKTGGITIGFGYDFEKNPSYSSMSAFAKSRWQIAKNASYYLYPQEKLSKVGLTAFKVKELAPIPVLLCRDTKPMTAQEIFDYDYNYWTQNSNTEWNALIQLAG